MCHFLLLLMNGYFFLCISIILRFFFLSNFKGLNLAHEKIHIIRVIFNELNIFMIYFHFFCQSFIYINRYLCVYQIVKKQKNRGNVTIVLVLWI